MEKTQATQSFFKKNGDCSLIFTVEYHTKWALQIKLNVLQTAHGMFPTHYEIFKIIIFLPICSINFAMYTILTVTIYFYIHFYNFILYEILKQV